MNRTTDVFRRGSASRLERRLSARRPKKGDASGPRHRARGRAGKWARIVRARATWTCATFAAVTRRVGSVTSTSRRAALESRVIVADAVATNGTINRLSNPDGCVRDDSAP